MRTNITIIEELCATGVTCTTEGDIISPQAIDRHSYDMYYRSKEHQDRFSRWHHNGDRLKQIRRRRLKRQTGEIFSTFSADGPPVCRTRLDPTTTTC